MGDPLFNDWSTIVRVLGVGGAAYVALLLMLRLSGKRTLAKLNAFDLVVTVALGSTLASILTSTSVSLADGVTALALLVALQFAVTWSSVRSSKVRGLVRSEPTLVARDGEALPGALHRERLTEEELLQVLRQQGRDGLEGVGAVVLETDGSFSVLDSPPGLTPGRDGPAPPT